MCVGRISGGPGGACAGAARLLNKLRNERLRGAGGGGSACKMMERNRNVALGGPKGLRRLQEEGYLVVVAAMDGLEIDTRAVAAGTRVATSSGVEAKRARIVFKQVPSHDDRQMPLASLDSLLTLSGQGPAHALTR